VILRSITFDTSCKLYDKSHRAIGGHNILHIYGEVFATPLTKYGTF